ncbi:MAG: hypothetical protein WC807_05775 [Hyphomicrobium sp.]
MKPALPSITVIGLAYLGSRRKSAEVRVGELADRLHMSNSSGSKSSVSAGAGLGSTWVPYGSIGSDQRLIHLPPTSDA